MTRLLRIALITIAGFAVMILIFLALLIAGGESEASLREAPDGPASIPSAAPVETTAEAAVEHELTVGSPEVGNVVTSPLVIEGKSTANQVGYRLFGAGLPLAEGTIIPDADGRFSTTVEFTNTCCIEMTLEVFDMQRNGGVGVSIPLAYPETS